MLNMIRSQLVCRCAVLCMLAAVLMCGVAGCGHDPNTPPVLKPGSAVSFEHQIPDEAFTYEFSDEQAKMFAALIHSPPSSVISPEEPRVTAMPPGIFRAGALVFKFHGAIEYTDADGYTFVWDHAFFHDHLWLPSDVSDPESIFEKMSGYEWPEDSD